MSGVPNTDCGKLMNNQIRDFKKICLLRGRPGQSLGGNDSLRATAYLIWCVKGMHLMARQQSQAARNGGHPWCFEVEQHESTILSSVQLVAGLFYKRFETPPIRSRKSDERKVSI